MKNHSYKKEITKNAIFCLLAVFFVFFTGCDDINSTQLPTTQTTEVDITINPLLPEYDNSERAAPDTNAYSNMTYRLTGIENNSGQEKEIGTWNDLASLKSASIKINSGSWELTLTAYSSYGSWMAEQERSQYKVLQSTYQGSVNANASLNLLLREIEPCEVKGSLYYTLDCSGSESIPRGRATLTNENNSSYSDNGFPYHETDNVYRISIDNIPSGNYWLRVSLSETEIEGNKYIEIPVQIAAGCQTKGSGKISDYEIVESYNIEYELNGSSSEVSMPEGYATTYTPSRSLVLENPVRQGYIFLGWYYNIDWNSDWKDENKLPTNTDGKYILNADLSLRGSKRIYARWTPKSSTDSYNNYSWTISKGGVLTISGVPNDNRVCVVPFYSSDFPSNTTSIVISEGITGLSNPSYSNESYRKYMQNIKSVVLPSTLTSIPDNCFKGCTELKEITIPESVNSIGSNAFQNCTSLRSIDFEESEREQLTIGSAAFSGCTSLSSITLPEDLTYISSELFENCTALTEMTIPTSVTYISYNAFENCTGISSITIPANVTNLPKSAFTGWTESQEITLDWNSTDNTTYRDLSDSNYSFKLNAHYKDGKTVWFSWSLNNDGVLTISGQGVVPFGPQSAWEDATSVIVEEGITGFRSYYYSDNTGFSNSSYQYTQNITSVTLPSTLTSIPDYCFYGCTSLEEIDIPDNVTSIGAYAFRGCSNLASITIPRNVTSLYMNAFYGWTAEQAILLDWNSTEITARSVNTNDFSNKDTINAHYKDNVYAWTLWTRNYYSQDGFTWTLTMFLL